VLAEGDHEMDRREVRKVPALICGLGALFLMLTGCTTWSDERQKHYAWLYQKCMRGEHQPYTIHMHRNHNSTLSQRCSEEYDHYVGSINQASHGVAMKPVFVMSR
jgi:hypothetical protein